MKKRTMPAIHLVLKPTYFILGCYGLISILCCIAVCLTPIPIIAKIGLVLLCIAYVIYIAQRDVLLRSPKSWQTITVNSEGVLRAYTKQGEMTEPVLASHTYIHPYLTILNFKQANMLWKQHQAIVITPWQVVEKDQYRQLRVWLKWWL